MVTGCSKQIVNWEERDLQFLNKIPFIRGISCKLFSNEHFSLVSSKVATPTKNSQACRQNVIFLADTRKLKDVNDVKSDLNGTFRKCYEVKCKIFDIIEKKVVSNEKRKLSEHELRIRVHHTENIYGLIRSFVFLEYNRRCIFCNRLVLQPITKYHITKDICGNVDSVTYQVLKHGNSKIEKAFKAIKKVL